MDEGYWIIQEKINQHPILANINYTSLNTIRIDTFLADSNEPEVISALLRFGRKNSIIDNVTSGGFFVGVNKDGKLKDEGYSFLKTGGFKIFEHPDSNVVFKNIQLPYWDEIIELVKKLAVLFPQIRAVGWDIAITENGPIVIEGNENYHLGMSEIASGGYLKNETFLNYFTEFKQEHK